MGNDQTLADCTDISVFAETALLAFFEDDEMESVMERASVGLLEAAEAMAKCNFQPRKALNMIDSQKNAELAAEKKAAEQACHDKIEEQEKNTRERKDAEENEQRKIKREKAKVAAEAKALQNLAAEEKKVLAEIENELVVQVPDHHNCHFAESEVGTAGARKVSAKTGGLTITAGKKGPGDAGA